MTDAERETLIVALLQRLHGRIAPNEPEVAFTRSELARAAQRHLVYEDNGHLVRLRVVNDT